MSKSPDSVPVGSYDGSGDWFKLWESGVCRGSPGQDGNWCLWQKDRIEVALPGNIPPGEYLVRVEHIGLHEAEKGRAQFYSEFLFFLFCLSLCFLSLIHSLLSTFLFHFPKCLLRGFGGCLLVCKSPMDGTLEYLLNVISWIYSPVRVVLGLSALPSVDWY